MKSGFVKRPGMVTRVQKAVVTAVLAVSAVVGLSGSTAGAWSSEDGAVAVWGGRTENDGLVASFDYPSGYESLAVDAAGSMYLAGQFQRSVDFNASPTGATTMTADYTAGCTAQSFVMKLDLFAEPYWAGQFGNDVSNSSCTVYPRSIAVDGNGNVYTTGNFNLGPVDFDPGAGVANLVNIASSTKTTTTNATKTPTATTTNWEKNKLVAPRPGTLPGESKSAKTN